jgi:mono/diheme cytochrome c family protein
MGVSASLSRRMTPTPLAALPEGIVLCYKPPFPARYFRHYPARSGVALDTAPPHEMNSPKIRAVSESAKSEAAPENRRFAMKFLSLIGALAIVIAVAAGVFFFGGFYNVAATQPDLDIVAWALERIRDASINRHAVDQPPVSMEDSATIQTGARAFASRGCASCHGEPGPDIARSAKWAKFSEGLQPDPPDLKDVAKEMTPAQIFWVIRNGINMTGMPGFNLVEAGDQEIWTITAFVKKLPGVSEADYQTWTAGAAPPTGDASPPK